MLSQGRSTPRTRVRHRLDRAPTTLHRPHLRHLMCLPVTAHTSHSVSHRLLSLPHSLVAMLSPFAPSFLPLSNLHATGEEDNNRSIRWTTHAFLLPPSLSSICDLYAPREEGDNGGFWQADSPPSLHPSFAPRPPRNRRGGRRWWLRAK